MRVSKHSYYLVEDLYYEYWIIPDFACGRRNRYTTLVVTSSGTIIIGRELTLSRSKAVIKYDIEHKAKRRSYRELNRVEKNLYDKESK